MSTTKKTVDCFRVKVDSQRGPLNILIFCGHMNLDEDCDQGRIVITKYGPYTTSTIPGGGEREIIVRETAK